MKKIYIITLLTLATALPAIGQRDHRPPQKDKEKPRAEITELVSNLSASQKRKLDNIQKESQARVTAMRDAQKAVKDSIVMYMNMEGDQSKTLCPLFERESKLKYDISMEMYQTKLRIDEVLTKEQRAELRKACDREAKKPPRRKSR